MWEPITAISGLIGTTATVIILLFGDKLSAKLLPSWQRVKILWKQLLCVIIAVSLIGIVGLVIERERGSSSDWKFQIGAVDAGQPEAAKYTDIARVALDNALRASGKADQNLGIKIDASVQSVGTRTLTRLAGNMVEGSAKITLSFQRPNSTKRVQVTCSMNAPESMPGNAVENAIKGVASELIRKLAYGEFAETPCQPTYLNNVEK